MPNAPVEIEPEVETFPPPDGVAHVPSPRQKVDDDADVPELRLPTGKLPVTPPAPPAARLIAGKSAPTSARGDTAPADPFGEAKTSFAVSLVPVIASVPELVTGEPPTVSHAGVVSPTLVTVPAPEGVAHVPSPRQYVDDEAPVPEFRFPTGKFPVTPPAPPTARLIAGKWAFMYVESCAAEACTEGTEELHPFVAQS
jgi:hypothetical protein